MKTVIDIFTSDIRSVVKRFFVLVIVLSLGIIPSLYAWINIYANWDPYVNTGNVEIALASRDPGIDIDGRHINSSSKVIADIKDDPDVGYRPLRDPDDAIEGVRSGKYYAAFVFEDGFTYDMYHFEEAIGDREPRITFYKNVKKNPIAGKITDSFAENLLKDINSEYLRATLTEYFSDTGEAFGELDSDEAVDTALEQLTGARDALHDYNLAIEQLASGSGNITQSLSNAEDRLGKARSKGKTSVSDAKKRIKQAKKTATNVQKRIDIKTSKIKKAIDDLNSAIGSGRTEDAVEQANIVLTRLQELRGIVPSDPRTIGGRMTAGAIDVMIAETEHIISLLQIDPGSSDIAETGNILSSMYHDELVTSLDLMISDILKALDRIEPLLRSTDGAVDNIDPVIDSAQSTINGLDSSLSGLQPMLSSLETKLDKAIEQVEKADADDRADILADIFGRDAAQYSSFITDLVQIDSHKLYEPVSYGAAMTPFYTIIALWVGAVMLVTILNVNVDRKRYPNLTETQGFFGRFLFFFLIGQIQAAVAVLGNIFLLHCSPVHPWLTWLSAAVTSMVFVMLIYALTLAFGDIGRAFVFVIMMLQIAGSSGTYPIEILPEIFDKIFLFFPFPYAINMMREAMFGMYRYDYLIYMGQLLIFCLVALGIGLFIRKPFIGTKQFMLDKMRETEVL